MSTEMETSYIVCTVITVICLIYVIDPAGGCTGLRWYVIYQSHQSNNKMSLLRST
jgi:hypothetical protein